MYHADMGSRTGVKVAVIGLVVVALGLVVWSSMGLSQVRVEACISYNGRTECRVAAGTSRDEAVRTATTMACATLASGMTERIACENTEPSKVEVQD